MDIGQAVSELSSAVITSGDLAALAGCDVAVLAASGAQHNLLESNMKILQSIAEPMARYCPAATVITASNPVDDSARFRIAIAESLNVPVKDVQAIVIGEHGPAMVPLFSAVFVRGEKVQLTTEQRDEISRFLKNYLATFAALKSGRTAAWTTAVGVGQIIAAIAAKSGEVLPGSAILWEAPSEAEIRAALVSLPIFDAGMLEIVLVAPLAPYPGFGPA